MRGKKIELLKSQIANRIDINEIAAKFCKDIGEKIENNRKILEDGQSSDIFHIIDMSRESNTTELRDAECTYIIEQLNNLVSNADINGRWGKNTSPTINEQCHMRVSVVVTKE